MMFGSFIRNVQNSVMEQYVSTIHLHETNTYLHLRRRIRNLINYSATNKVLIVLPNAFTEGWEALVRLEPLRL